MMTGDSEAAAAVSGHRVTAAAASEGGSGTSGRREAAAAVEEGDATSEMESGSVGSLERKRFHFGIRSTLFTCGDRRQVK